MKFYIVHLRGSKANYRLLVAARTEAEARRLGEYRLDPLAYGGGSSRIDLGKVKITVSQLTEACVSGILMEQEIDWVPAS